MPEPEQTGGAGEQVTNQENTSGLTFDTWITEQPEHVRSMLDSNTAGLKSALESERTARKQFEKQLKDLAGKAEKGSELEQKLAEIVKAQERTQSQAEFYEQAHAAGVSNLKLAFIVAEQGGLIDGRGRVNFDDMRKQYPELFGERPKPSGKAGAGTSQPQPATGNPMNTFIRSAAGRK